MSRQDGAEAKAVLAKRLEELRAARGLDQREAAKRAHVSLRSWSRYENQEVEPGYSTLANIARALDVAPSALFDELTREQLGQLPTWNDRVDDRLDEILALVRDVAARQEVEGGVDDALRQAQPRPEGSDSARRSRRRTGPAP